MAQDYPGFLRENQREYLKASEAERKEMRKDNPNIPRRIRKRLNGAEKDWGLVYASDADVANVDLTKERVMNNQYTRTKDKIERGIENAKAQKQAYIGDDLFDLDGKSVDECLDQLEGKQSEMRQFMGEAIIESIIDFGGEADAFTDEQLRRFVEIIYPEKDETLEIVEERLSNR
jgi:hypothetical protein